MSDELLRAMWTAFRNACLDASRKGFDANLSDAMRAVLDVLQANGYRRCAEGQKVTQYCSAWEQADKACRDLAEKVIPNLRERADRAEAEVERLTACLFQMQEAAKEQTAEVERLRERAERAEDIAKSVRTGAPLYDMLEQRNAAITRAEQAEAEVERLRADAERYLWLIDNIDPADAGLPQPVDYWGTRDPVWKRQIDAAIDAAIRARGES